MSKYKLTMIHCELKLVGCGLSTLLAAYIFVTSLHMKYLPLYLCTNHHFFCKMAFSFLIPTIVNTY